MRGIENSEATVSPMRQRGGVAGMEIPPRRRMGLDDRFRADGRDAARKSVSVPAGRAMKNAWNSGRGKKGTGTKFRKGGENSSQPPFCALMFFEGNAR